MIPKHILDLLDIKHTAQDPIPYRVTTKPRPCDDCGKTVENRTVNINLCRRGEYAYWRRSCNICRLSSLDGETWQNSATIESKMRRKQ